MIYWIPAIVLILAVVLAGLLAAQQRLSLARSVLLRLPCERAWDVIRDFPALHAAHTRGRPHLVIAESLLREGSGCGPGSVWRQKGWWRGGDYWADLEVTEWDPPRRLSVRLVRDSLSTQRGLLLHRGELTLVPEGPLVTKLIWRLNARMGAARLLLARLLWPERMRARLLDIGLRSLKRAIDGDRGEDRIAARAPGLEADFRLRPGARLPEPQARPSPSPPPSSGRLQDQP